MVPLPFTPQELKALILLSATGLAGVTIPLVIRTPPIGHGLTGQVAAPTVVNLNTASAEELAALRGIGPALAARMVEERRQHGLFLRVGDLTRVKGVSPTLVARLKSQLAVE